MNERELLLKAVCDNPHDDTPRLVFADWLQEHGDEERAEFIRVQIQLARATHRPSEEARLKRRERKLSARTEQWKNEVPEAEHVSFACGFVERAWFLSGAAFERAIGAAPFRHVTIRGPVDLIAVLKITVIDRVESLDLEDAAVREPDVEAFAENDWPRHPKRLFLPHKCVPEELRNRILSRFRDWVSVRLW